MADNPYISTNELASATDPSPIAPRAIWFACASWVIVLIQGICLVIGIVIAFSGRRELGSNLILLFPILGVASIVTTLVASVLTLKSWFRKERTKHFYIALILCLLHFCLLGLGAALLVAGHFAQ